MAFALLFLLRAPSKPHTASLPRSSSSAWRLPLSLLSRRIRFFLDQALDRLVLTSFRIAAFTPSTYQPCRLQGVLPACAVGYFFSRGASRLDAFSVYPVQTWLLCHGLGTQQIHQRSVHPGPLVLTTAPLKYPTPTPDRDRTVAGVGDLKGADLSTR